MPAIGPIPDILSCTKCGETKPFVEFQRNSRMPFGRTKRCKQCAREIAKEWYRLNSERGKENARRRRLLNPQAVKACNKRHREENPELYREYGRKYIAANPEKVAESRRRAKAKQKSNPRNRLAGAMSAGVRDAIRGKKVKRTFDLLGYSVEDLMAHLESNFLPGMSWDNYGRNGWHVDHIIPLSAFNYETPEHRDFSRAWALKNLRPLWEVDNLRKRNKLDRPFQPSLCL